MNNYSAVGNIVLDTEMSKKGYSPLNLDADSILKAFKMLEKIPENMKHTNTTITELFNKLLLKNGNKPKPFEKREMLMRRSSSRRGWHFTFLHNGRQVYMKHDKVIKLREEWNDDIGRIRIDKLKLKFLNNNGYLPDRIGKLFTYKNGKNAGEWEPYDENKIFELDKKKLIRKYYKVADLYLPPNSRWRQFRFILFTGEMIKIKDRITSIDQLRKHLIRLVPKHVYYTLSEFIDPTVIGPRYIKNEGYTLAYNLFMRKDTAFDIDSDDLSDATVRAKKLVSELSKMSHPTETIYSGSRGFHVKSLHPPEIIEENPRKREYKYRLYSEDLVAKLKSRGAYADWQTTIDTRRIIRLPLTIHGTTMNICEKVDDLDTFKPRGIDTVLTAHAI